MIRTRDAVTHVDVHNPAKSTDHVRLRDGVSSVQDDYEKTQTSHCLCTSFGLERRRERAKPRFHCKAHHKQEQEEHTSRSEINEYIYQMTKN